MKLLSCILTGVAIAALPLPAVPAANDAAAPACRLTAELRDGSRVVSTGTEKDVRFHSALFGDFQVAIPQIRSVECGTRNTATLLTTNGDRLAVSFVDANLPLKTAFGKIDVAVAQLRKLTVSATGNGAARLPGLVALWSGEGNGKDSVDSHDANLTDMSFADGQVGQAFSLNGYSSWATIPADRAVNLTGAKGITVSAWIKPNNVDGFHPILEWEVTRQKSAVQVWLGNFPQAHGVLSCNVGGTDGISHPIASPPGTIVAGQFQFIALTYDKTSGISRLFVNGQIVAEKNFGPVEPDTTGPIFISRRPCDQPGDWTYNTFFSGLLDEMAIYNRALSPEEIKAICMEQNNGELPAAPQPGGNYQTFQSRDLGF